MSLRFFILAVVLGSIAFPSDAQRSRGISDVRYRVEGGDTVLVITLRDIPVPYFKKKRDMRTYARLVRAVKLTYPIALEANRRLREMEAHLMTLPSEKEQRIYIKSVEDSLKEEYTPVLKKMSMYQGMVLLKLIDRETGKTSFRLVQELRGKFSAFFWQGVARLFGANLKLEYDREGDDAVIEYLIGLYEEGLL